MARIRSIKPEITTSETLASLPIEVCYTFAILWPYCDDQGRHPSNPKLLKAALYPLRDEVSTHDVELHIKALEAAGLICLYVGCDGKAYLHVVNWSEHQRVDKPSSPRIPRCPAHEADAKCLHHAAEPCGSPQVPLSVRSPTPPRILPEPSPTGSRTLDLGSGTLEVGPLPPRTGGAEHSTNPRSVNQQANEIATAYVRRVPLSNHQAVAGVLRKALNAGYQAPVIALALGRLADQARSVTADSLRIELEGPPKKRSTTDQRVTDTLAIVAKLEESGL